MALTAQQNMSLIRLLLDEPDPDAPKEHLLFELFGNQVMHHVSQLANSGAPWAVNSVVITASTGIEDYQISATDFGKPFWIHSEDATDPYKPRVEIAFSMIQNVDMFYQGPRMLYSTSDNNPRAAVISIYRTPSGYYARITPVPGGSCEYRIWYEVAPDQPASLGDTTGISPFNHLIRIQTAIAALPYARWGALSVDAPEDKQAMRWTAKVKTMAESFIRQEAQYQRQFEAYIGSLMQSGVEARDGFGDDYIGNSYFEF
jgi:hypothetical protein